MTSLSSSASTSAKTVNNNAQKNISVSVCEKNALTAVNGRKKENKDGCGISASFFFRS